METNNLGR
jgi:hypothetical protein